jgi:hypothetical protein
MKRPIMTKATRFSMDDVKEQIAEIVGVFDAYLDEYPIKTYRTKHAVMGPVGKILDGVQTGRWDADSLTGYALRIHEMNPLSYGISVNARNALETGVRKLYALKEQTPVTSLKSVIERIDYGLYYARRKKGIDRLEAIRQDYIAFLKERYDSNKTLAEAWGREITFDNVRYPSRHAFAQAKGQERKDMAEFIQQAELKGYALDEEE